MIEIKTTDEAPELKSEPLFSIDGVEYSARTEYRASESLTYMNLLVRKGFNFAWDWALRTSLGSDGYAALMDCEHLSDEQLQAIMTKILEPLTGPVSGPKA
jgi:hypothetical protein